ncbi:MAG: acetyl-CoA carboxylase biotin carboxyl carrier protein [Gemmatimonadetes bacterium]|nr:acetyl-CoA carboxylase biotin carboxyl carrier protein [Gemmatimonadota bacterium]MBI3081335.1 acetyl-CoA carboxylase biotin carboxyl carrier protein [Gemmatimonadota bacterium]
MDFAFLEKLLDLLNRSNADTIEIRRWTTTVRVSKGGGGSNSGHVTYHLAPPPAGVAAVAGGAAAGAGSAASAAPPAGGVEDERKNWLDLKSPMVGTFYARPEPGADPYVRVGSRISVGQTLCIIEAMKIMNPLDAELSGVIREIPVEDVQPVEFGQVLFRVDPHG